MSELSPLAAALVSARSRVGSWPELAGHLGFSADTLQRARHPGPRPLRASTEKELAFAVDFFLSGQPTPDPPPPRPVEGDRWGRDHSVGLDPVGRHERAAQVVLAAVTRRDSWEDHHGLGRSALAGAARALDVAEMVAVGELSPAAAQALTAASKGLVATLQAFGLMPAPQTATVDPLEAFRDLDPAQDHRPPA